MIQICLRWCFQLLYTILFPFIFCQQAEEGVSPEDTRLPLFLADMEGKTYTFQVRVIAFNFTEHHKTFTITRIAEDHGRLPVDDVNNKFHVHHVVSLYACFLLIRICITKWMSRGMMMTMMMMVTSHHLMWLEVACQKADAGTSKVVKKARAGWDISTINNVQTIVYIMLMHLCLISHVWFFLFWIFPVIWVFWF